MIRDTCEAAGCGTYMAMNGIAIAQHDGTPVIIVPMALILTFPSVVLYSVYARVQFVMRCKG
jgi:hypothetical protein